MNKKEKNVIMKTDLLCKSFVSDGEINNVIKNISLEIYKGDFTVIMGSSGSGKSTLLYMLSGMMEATSGETWLDGEDISRLSESRMAKKRRERMGFVFQSINLIPDLNVYENIISPAYKNGLSREQQRQRAEELAKMVGLSDQLRKYPGQLSGGQRQRAAICRALMNEPDILFADEPTGALNSAQGENILDVFSGLHQKGQSVVMVTHDLKAALRGNRIIFINDGRIDGDLQLNEYSKEDIEQRRVCVYNFLQERGW